MAFTSLRIAPNFLLSFTGLLDDLWYYQYHRNVYPQVVQFFTQKIDIMNELRLHPWFLNSIDFINTPLVCNKSNELMYEYLNFTSDDPESVYFLHSAEDTYKSNLIMNILFLFVLKILYFMFVTIQKRLKLNNYNVPSFFKIIISNIKYNSRWWCLLVACFEMNMLKLTFNCFIQVLLPSNTSFFDKFNIVVTFSFLFILFQYCLCFYALTYQFVN